MGHMKQLAIQEEENIYEEMLEKIKTAETCQEVIDFMKNEIAKRVPYKLSSFESWDIPRITSEWNDYQRQLGEND
jgi:hypothetical protein|tara:strand:+ start:377 stop:601 length:225 start_codon:yes stop_codon:yes gene_type:complete